MDTEVVLEAYTQGADSSGQTDKKSFTTFSLTGWNIMLDSFLTN